MWVLAGRTQKGRNRVRELGAEWRLVRESAQVLFSRDPGPWWLLEPVRGPADKSRWVHATRDPDFEVLAR